MQLLLQLLEHFSKAVLRSEPSTCSAGKDSTEREQQLVWAMSQNYRNMFRVPMDLQREVELHLHKDRNRQVRPIFNCKFTWAKMNDTMTYFHRVHVAH